MLLSPVAERNKDLILEVLAGYVDNTNQGFGLELASGTGQHVVHFAQAVPNVTWQPSEISPSAHESISAYIRATKVQNVKEPLTIDELVHGVGQLLKPGGLCMIYGPFAINGIISPECNVELHEKLQGRNPAWGLRDVEELRQLATPAALRLEHMLEMPEHTKCLIFRRRDPEIA